MRVECSILTCIHLDPGYALLSVQNTLTCMEVFNMMDIHRTSKINDVQFFLYLKNITNLNRNDIDEIFNMLDVDHSGEIEFDEFYLLFCILIANKDQYEKEFIYRHSGTIFQLIDADASGQINSSEFNRMGVLFNFDSSAIKRIFTEFDISGDKNLDFAEFRLFTMACIDEARAQETREKVKAFGQYRARLLASLEPTLRRFVRTDRLPRPREIEDVVNHVRHPFIPGKKDFRRHFKYGVIRENFMDTRTDIRDYFKKIIGSIPCLFCCIGYLLCCYCCVEDPMVHYSDGKSCRMCRCKCRCLPCWGTFLRKFWTCCNCMFPCCHCCQIPQQHDYHIARQRKMKRTEPLQYRDSVVHMEDEKKENRPLSRTSKSNKMAKKSLNQKNEMRTSKANAPAAEGISIKKEADYRRSLMQPTVSRKVSKQKDRSSLSSRKTSNASSKNISPKRAS